eukprot:2253712-Pleurochrysis_carterae.AAC.1
MAEPWGVPAGSLQTTALLDVQAVQLEERAPGSPESLCLDEHEISDAAGTDDDYCEWGALAAVEKKAEEGNDASDGDYDEEGVFICGAGGAMRDRTSTEHDLVQAAAEQLGVSLKKLQNTDGSYVGVTRRGNRFHVKYGNTSLGDFDSLVDAVKCRLQHLSGRRRPRKSQQNQAAGSWPDSTPTPSK